MDQIGCDCDTYLYPDGESRARGGNLCAERKAARGCQAVRYMIVVD